MPHYVAVFGSCMGVMYVPWVSCVLRVSLYVSRA
jgi:hypothetical protein